MKNLLLSLLLLSSISTYALNQAPIATFDTINYSFANAHRIDSLELNIPDLLHNDYDPDGSLVNMVDIIYSGPHSFSTFKPTGTTITSLFFTPKNGFSGKVTFQYIIKDRGTPVKFDTTQVTIFIARRSFETLKANNIGATITTEILFAGGDHQSPGLEVPINSGLFSLYGSNLWIAGSVDGVMYSNSRKWGSPDNSGIGSVGNPGPVSNSSNTGSMFNTHWNRVWKITKVQIDHHLANYQSNGYVAPEIILEWPTHGIILKGEAPFLAPYFDRNNDLLYDPYDGDYPLIKGDEAIYFMYNDGNSPIDRHPMTTEVHGMAYAFSCGDSALHNTIFVDFRVINRSSNTYVNTSFGLWADFDIGGMADDFMGCDVMRNFFYAYNGDDYDDLFYDDTLSYESYPPAIGTILLKGAPQDPDGLDNSIGIDTNQSINGTGFGDGIIDNEFWGLEFSHVFSNGINEPNTDLEFSRIISGLSSTNTPWQTHINGSSISTPYKYMYPGNSDPWYYGTFGAPISNWTEHTSNNTPEDRRVVGSTGLVTFSPGDEINLSYAFVFGRDYVNQGAQAGVTNMLKRVDSIRSYYDQGLLTPCGFPTSITPINETSAPFKLYPNPTENLVQIEQLGNEELHIKLMDISGKVLVNKSSSQKIISLRLGDFPKGIYLIEVQNTNERKVLKVVKH